MKKIFVAITIVALGLFFFTSCSSDSAMTWGTGPDGGDEVIVTPPPGGENLNPGGGEAEEPDDDEKDDVAQGADDGKEEGEGGGEAEDDEEVDDREENKVNENFEQYARVLSEQDGPDKNAEPSFTGKLSNSFEADGFDIHPLSAQSGTPGYIEPTNSKKIFVWLQTGPFMRAGTDCKVTIEFCATKNFSYNCSGEITLNDTKIDDRERGDRNLYSLNVMDTVIKSNQRYFKISVTGGGKKGEWLLWGIRVLVLFEGGKSYHYYNPCLTKWIGREDSLRFGPNDTALCTIIQGGEDKTEDSISLLVASNAKNEKDIEFTDGSKWSKYGPTLTLENKGSTVHRDNYMEMKLNWKKVEKYDQSFYNFAYPHQLFTYGNYVFDSNPFGEDKGLVKIKKNGVDDWEMAGAEVFIFNPAKTLPNDTIRYAAMKERKFDNNNTTYETATGVVELDPNAPNLLATAHERMPVSYFIKMPNKEVYLYFYFSLNIYTEKDIEAFRQRVSPNSFGIIGSAATGTSK